MKGKGPSRLARTVRSLLAMIGLGVGLAVYNAVTLARDVSTATGPHSEAQHEFFLAAADRPDIELFFKKLSHTQKMAMAQHIGEYSDPKLATVIGKLLGTFDAEARGLLTQALTNVGKQNPQAAADQLKQTGSLQQVAIGTALRSIGDPVLPAVVSELKVTEARTNAVAYLVATGHPSVPFLLPALKDENKDVRLAAADAVGKIGSREGVPELTRLYEGSAGDEKFGYLAALAGIGAPESEGLLTKAVDDPTLTASRQAQAMLGLGRVGSDSAIRKLWSLSGSDDPQVRDSVVSALQLSGARSLPGATSAALGLRVAAGIHNAEADKYITRALGNPSLVKEVSAAAAQRPSLVPILVASLRGTDDGEVVDAIMRTLVTTTEGQVALMKLENDPKLGGFAYRRLKLSGAG